MKTLLSTLFSLVILCAATISSAQAPQGVNYQAVLRDGSGDILASAGIDVRFTIHESTSSGTTVYEENHLLTTNAYGLITAVIGEGTVTSGTFSAIDWLSEIYFLQVEVNDGGGYIDMGTTQLMSVPYALAADEAQTAETATNMSLDDLTDANGAGAAIGEVLEWDGSEWVPATDDSGGGGGDDWGSQVAATDATLTGDGTAGNPLGIATNGVSNAEISAGAVGTSELNDGSIQAVDLNQMGAAAGEVLEWNGAAWAPATDDVSGGGGIGGSGTANYLSKFTAGTTLGNSVVYETGSNIGIGTTSPSTKLHIVSSSSTPLNIDGTAGMYVGLYEAGIYRGYYGSYSGAAPDVDFGTGGGNTTGSLHLAIQGSPSATITSAGNMGIGTTAPGAKLEVAGQIKITGGTPGAGQVLTSDGTGLATWEPMVGGSGTTSYIPKWTASTTLGSSVIYETGGYVGINTTAPGAGLVVSGAGIWSSAIGINNTTSGMEWRMNVNGSTFQVTKIPGSTFTPFQLFSTGEIGFSNSAGTSTMYIANTGKIGIGTTAPNHTQEIYDAGGNPYTNYTNPSTGQGAFSQGLLVGMTNSFSYVYSYEAEDLILSTNSGSARITINPDSKIEFRTGFAGTVGSDLNLKQSANVSGTGGIMFEETGAADQWKIGYGSVDDFDMYWNGVLNGYFQNTSGTYIAVSDASLKTDVEPLNNMLSVIAQLNPVKYHFKAAIDEQKSYGFIAQEVEKVLPGIVHEKDGLKTLAYTDFGVISVQAIKELNDLVKAQQLQLDELKKRIQELEAR